MVDVYLAQARSVAGFQKAVAIKMIRDVQSDEDPDFVRQLVEEANIASRLSHKNVVQVIDLGEIDRQHYIAMEYVDGVDLGWLLSRLGPRKRHVAPRVAAYVMREVCEGLDHAHRMADAEGRPLRIVHRDVTPANILVSFAGEVKLTDFGLAKASLRAASPTTSRCFSTRKTRSPRASSRSSSSACPSRRGATSPRSARTSSTTTPTTSRRSRRTAR